MCSLNTVHVHCGKNFKMSLRCLSCFVGFTYHDVCQNDQDSSFLFQQDRKVPDYDGYLLNYYRPQTHHKANL